MECDDSCSFSIDIISIIAGNMLINRLIVPVVVL
jgi:hypothetical protein